MSPDQPYVSSSPKAVFLSYASQDAEAARHICDALQAMSVEVWFDQSALRGGDAWDASIRRQIKDCALFVPIISANTQAREEGYFRREWNLAVEPHAGHGRRQGVPAAGGDRRDARRRTPACRRNSATCSGPTCPTGESSAAFAEHVQRLLSGGAAPAPVASARAVAITTAAAAVAARQAGTAVDRGAAVRQPQPATRKTSTSPTASPTSC